MAWFRKKMWLDVEGGWQGWIDTPLSGADASTAGWGASGNLLNGGGYSLNSWGTHKQYSFEWSGASSRQAAQFMQGLRSGVYGKGLIHFIEPTIYDTNILPARVAAPFLSINDGGRPLMPRFPANEVESGVSVGSPLPVTAARWEFHTSETGFPGAVNSIRVPVPDGYSLVVGAKYDAYGAGRVHTGVFVRSSGSSTMIPSTSGVGEVADQFSVFSGDRHPRIWFGKTTTAPSSLVVTAITARLVPTKRITSSLGPGYGYGDQPYGEGPYGGIRLASDFENVLRGPWVGGMGNSGVRFNGTPTMVHNTGVNGGQVGFAASFIETGAWG